MTRSIKIDESVYRKIKKIAKKEKRNLKFVLEIAVIQYLQKKVLEE